MRALSRLQTTSRWFAKFFHRSAPVNPDEDRKALKRLRWLLDAPQFIDETLIERLFDAVVRPSYEIQSRQVGEISEIARRQLVGGEGEVKFEHGLSFLTGTLKLRGQVSGERETTGTNTTTTSSTEIRVNTAGRRLEEIALVYLTNHPDKIVFIDTCGRATNFQGRRLTIQDLDTVAEEPPRMLAFVEISKETPIIPMACELEDGMIVRLYEKYINECWSKTETRPEYPADAADPSAERDYWDALTERFSSKIALEVVEAAGSGKIGWIDFRIPLGKAGDTMHLHIVPGGRYYTGNFAYNLVRRGFHHGIRVVGTLRAGLSLNALAIFDR